ncbi:hypothetical protein, partial [Limnospira sp. PMC 1252.20]|uniref:hypothetical protein n=1 Tax=Limnospira sp. PMC 1252.20 TaxID=2981050 RepID=UPI0028E0AFA1
VDKKPGFSGIGEFMNIKLALGRLGGVQRNPTAGICFPQGVGFPQGGSQKPGFFKKPGFLALERGIC